MPIHPAAHVHPDAVIDPTTEIGPGTTVEAGVTIGPDNRIGPNVFIGAGTSIGVGNRIHGGASIGDLPQDRSHDGGATVTRIGDRNWIREFVTIHRASRPGGATVVGDDCMLMVNTHVAHDCRVGDGVTMTNGGILAGHVTVGAGAFLSAVILVHQHVRIGRLAMLTPLSKAAQDVPPFCMAGGSRAMVHGLNVVALRRAGLDAATRARIQEAHRVLFRAGLTRSEALAVLREDPTPEVQELAAFVAESKRGIVRFGHAQRDDGDEA